MKLLKYNILTLRISGLWPDDPRSKLKYFRRDIFIIFIIYPLFYFGSISQLVHQLQEKSGNFMLLFLPIVSIIKGMDIILNLNIFYYKRSKMIDLQRQLNELDNFFKCPELVQTEKKIRKYTVLILLYGFTLGTPFVISPILRISQCKEQRDIILQTTTWPCGFYTPLWYPFPVHKNPYYYIILSTMVIHDFSFLMFGFGYRNYMFAIIEHIMRHLRNLKRNLKIAIESKGTRVKLGKCINYHIAIIRFFHNVDDCYAYISLTFVTLISVILAVEEYYLASELTLEGILKFLPEIITWLFMLFLLSYVSQNLWNESLTLSECLYDFDWENCHISMQHDLQLILQNMQKPLTLSYGPYGYLGFENFVHILSSAYSFFAILINLRHNY